MRCWRGTYCLGPGTRVQTEEVAPDMSPLLIAPHIKIPPPPGPPCSWQKLSRSFFVPDNWSHVLVVIIWSCGDWENARFLTYWQAQDHLCPEVLGGNGGSLSDVHKEFSSFFKSTSLSWKMVWMVAREHTKVAKVSQKVRKRPDFHLLTHCLFLLKPSSKLFKICHRPKAFCLNMVSEKSEYS